MEGEDVMQDKKENVKKEAKKNYLMLFAVTLIIGVFSCGLIGWSYIKQSADVKQLKIQKVILEKSKVEEVVKSSTFMKELDECHAELDKMRERMAGIKNVDDLLRRDIFLYIDKKFQLIPKTVSITIAEEIVKQAKESQVSPELVVGIIQVESAFNPMAISSKNARGLMQVMPEWAKKFGLKKVSDLHDIDTNISSGIRVLQIHVEEEKGNISKGLYRYVGKSESYAGKVYAAMGKFVAFRSTIDDDKADIDINGKDEEGEPEGDKPKH